MRERALKDSRRLWPRKAPRATVASSEARNQRLAPARALPPVGPRPACLGLQHTDPASASGSKPDGLRHGAGPGLGSWRRKQLSRGGWGPVSGCGRPRRASEGIGGQGLAARSGCGGRCPRAPQRPTGVKATCEARGSEAGGQGQAKREAAALRSGNARRAGKRGEWWPGRLGEKRWKVTSRVRRPGLGRLL